MRRIALLAAAFAIAATDPPAHAGCSIVPSTAMQSAPLFYGPRGFTTSPFLIPGERLLVGRRACDQGTALTDVADARVVVMLQPPDDDPHALILKQGTDGPCADEDTFTTGCAESLGAGDRVTCLAISDFTLKDGLLDIMLPAPGPSATGPTPTATGATPTPTKTPIRVSSGDVAVAVARASANAKDEGKKLCTQLVDHEDTCTKAMSAVSLHACIDEFMMPTEDPNPPCTFNGDDDRFPGPTLLPLPNNSRAVCGKGDPDGVCGSEPAAEIRYTADAKGNLLVPFHWGDSLDPCGACRRLKVEAEVEPPRRLDIPGNADKPSRNDWLRSYTYDGRRNDPAFAKLDSAHTKTRAFWGRTDVDKSVLWFGRSLEMCPGKSNKACRSGADCANGAACEQRCSNDHAKPCATDPICAGGTCGKLFDYTPAMKDGRWYLDRSSPASFCEKHKTTACPANCSSGACVSYLLELGPCDCGGPKLAPTPAPSVEAASLARAFNLETKALIASAVSDDGAWLAAIVPVAAIREASHLPASCRTAGGSRVLAIAERKGCTDASCVPTCPVLGDGKLQAALVVAGSQVRVLQDPPAPPVPAKGWFERLIAWWRTPGTEEARTGLPSLHLVDARHPTVVTTIANVVTSNPAYTPMFVSPDTGSTIFLVKAGRCVSNGRTLGIPSVCRPERADECPSWATCQPDNIVVAADLSIDQDDDGVPDRLDDVVTRRPDIRPAPRRPGP